LVIFLLDRFAYSTERGKLSYQFPVKLLNALCQVSNSQSVMQKQPHYYIGFQVALPFGFALTGHVYLQSVMPYRDANILHDENWVLDQAELPIDTLFLHMEVICGLQRKLVSHQCSTMHDQDGIVVHCDQNAHGNTTRREEKSPGAGGQLDQGSRPAIALRFQCGGSAGQRRSGAYTASFLRHCRGTWKKQEPWLPIRPGLPIRPPNLGLRKRNGSLRFCGYEAQPDRRYSPELLISL
jgi:hypothetical protein